MAYRWVVAAVLVLSLASFAFGERNAGATSYDSEELQVLDLINEYRKDNGAGPLVLSDTLSVAAERHSEDMGEHNFFAHDTAASSYYRAGAEPWDRMEAEGYDFNTYKGENIAAGYESAEEAFEAWRNSPSHNAAMLDERFRAIGISRVNVAGSAYGWYWTTDFGAVLDRTEHAPEGDSEGDPDTSEAASGKKEKPEDLGGVENGAMSGKGVWKQEAKDGADLILDKRARLGGYHSGRDDFSQKIRVQKNDELSFGIKITTAEPRHPKDRLLVRLTNAEGKQIAVLRKYTGADAGGWRRAKLDVSRYAGRTVYLSFFVETDRKRLTTFYLDNVRLESGERS